MQKKLIVAPSPFLRNTQVTTRSIMLDVIIAMLPTALAAVWYFGAPALSVMLVCVLSCVVAEWAYQKLTHQPVTTGDLSAVVTGLLLAFNMPASAPWWMGVVGSVIAIVLVKQMFGGIGQNFINPALAARTVLMLSWTVLMAANVMPQAGQIFGIDPNAVKVNPVAIIQTVSAEGTSEATAAATGETAAEPAAPAAEATAEATAAATGETAAEPAAPVAEATAEATAAATGETAAEPAAPVAEATAEATAAATGETAAEPAAPAAEATAEATAAATGETAAEPAAPAVEATAEATAAATGETAAEPAAPAAEATAEATAAATGETVAAPAAEATAEATAAATGETAAAPAAEATTEATAAATGETAAAPAAEATTEATAAATGETAAEATTEATSASTAAVEATAEATGAATAVEATSVATPLSASAKPGDYSLWDLFSGNIPGMLGETCKLTLLLGGLYLIFRRVIDWRIPVSFIVTAFILFWIHTGVIYSPESGSQNALYQLLSGGLILGAFFMATDYVTSPITKWGRVIMGIGCAVVLYVIRFFNAGYPEGCSFAILFMNVLTPLIDRYTARKPFGYTKPAKEGAGNA